MYSVDKMIIPKCEEFISALGCDCYINDDYVQYIEIDNEHEVLLRISFGLLDGLFKIYLAKEDDIILEMYEKDLLSIYIHEDDSKLEINFYASENEIRTIILVIYPKIKLLSSYIG
ncbi:hypothetical protein [Acinetobacter pollinis]|uniref:Uncharacterized protein n=1 Tax=Acinetobacter pollinis TaxID=2605270 RepID=A0ABU6DXS2_9GAMM|nr:hypothetical protein [Acinetobacter pollinis]MEB5477663.1 hypothetical protein [Acinetobacter pollinis]